MRCNYKGALFDFLEDNSFFARHLGSSPISIAVVCNCRFLAPLGKDNRSIWDKRSLKITPLCRHM